MEQIEKVIKEEIRPALNSDGGDLQIVSLEGKVLKIKYQGACGCCPHAAMGTLRFIERTLREKCDPEITVVMG
jgi:Fe-S cluster biogenesis protein NfuA